MTTGTYDDPQLVCAGHHPATVLGRFERDDLEPGERCRECGTTLGEARYDGAAINQEWNHAWPSTVTDVTDDAHEFSPVLQAPVANLLGEPWYLQSDCPGASYVTWLDLPTGGRIGVSPHPAQDQTMRWAIVLTDDDGNPVHHEHELAITETPEAVATRVHELMTTWGIDRSCNAW